MSFEEVFRERQAQVQDIVYSYMPAEEGFAHTVIEAMNYSMKAGGKRLRPMLMLETYRLFGGCSRVIEPFMAAIEMIHTHSLIHDDLPAIDNDEYRRGRKTTHIVYGEAMAILAGDGLLNFAYETACRAFEMAPADPAVGKAMAILTRKTGIFGMLGGQTVDVEAVGQPLSQEKLDFIYRLKTGALIESAMTIGAVLAGADEASVKMTEQIAADVGLAFQIQDDILDIVSTQQELGKPTGSDEKNNKTTYVTLKGLDAAKQDVASVSMRAIDTLDRLPGENVFLTDLIRSLITRRY